MSDIKQATLDTKAIADFVSTQWDTSIVPSLVEYIKIPNTSPLYDPDIHTNGYQVTSPPPSTQTR
jgi:hypothetical protein